MRQNIMKGKEESKRKKIAKKRAPKASRAKRAAIKSKLITKKEYDEISVKLGLSEFEKAHMEIIHAYSVLAADEKRKTKTLPSINEVCEFTKKSRVSVSNHIAAWKESFRDNVNKSLQDLMLPHVHTVLQNTLRLSKYNPGSQRLFFQMLGWDDKAGDSTTEDKDTNINIVINKKKDEDQAESTDNKVIDV